MGGNFGIVLIALCLFATATPGTEPSVSETWFVIEFDGSPVGYEHMTSRPLSDGLSDGIVCSRRTRLNLKRAGQDLTLEASLSTRQTENGILLEFDLQREDGSGSRTERHGEYLPDHRVFRMSEKANATRRSFDLRVADKVYSPLLDTWLPSLLEQSSRSVTMPVLFPESAAVAVISAARKPSRKIRIQGGGSIDAGRILFYPQLDPARSTTFFTDPQGRVIRQEKQLVGGTLALVRTTSDVALATMTEQSLDLDLQAVIPVDRLLSARNSRQELVLEFVVTKGFLPDIPDATFQKVERTSSMSARITLTQPTLPRPGPGPAPQVISGPLLSTHWMPLDNPTLQRAAVIGAVGKSDPGEVCRQLERFVHAEMRHSAFSTAILTADEIIKVRRGDCTEHAVLLATLMRIKGIPARLAAGLVHTNRQFGFVGHVWVEALIENQWIPFDSTVGLERLGITHVKLTDSEMPDEMTSGVSLFLPVLDLAGRTRVKVISDQ